MKMIEESQNAIRAYRNKHGRHSDYHNIIVDFINDVEKIANTQEALVDFHTALTAAGSKMNDSFTKIDKNVFIDIDWNLVDEGQPEAWKNLKVDRINITWSDHFVEKTGKNKNETVDVAHLFIEGYF